MAFRSWEHSEKVCLGLHGLGRASVTNSSPGLGDFQSVSSVMGQRENILGFVGPIISVTTPQQLLWHKSCSDINECTLFQEKLHFRTQVVRQGGPMETASWPWVTPRDTPTITETRLTCS